MPPMAKKIYIDKSDAIVNNYNNTHHRTSKIKPVDVKSSTYVDLIISKHKNIFARDYVPKVTNTVPWTHVISDLKLRKCFESFTKKNCRKQVKGSLEL